MSKSIKEFKAPTKEEIAICAHGIYEKEGRPNGKAMQHWLQAEAQLIAERKAQAAESATSAPGKSGNNWPAPARAKQQTLVRN